MLEQRGRVARPTQCDGHPLWESLPLVGGGPWSVRVVLVPNTLGTRREMERGRGSIQEVRRGVGWCGARRDRLHPESRSWSRSSDGSERASDGFNTEPSAICVVLIPIQPKRHLYSRGEPMACWRSVQRMPWRRRQRSRRPWKPGSEQHRRGLRRERARRERGRAAWRVWRCHRALLCGVHRDIVRRLGRHVHGMKPSSSVWAILRSAESNASGVFVTCAASEVLPVRCGDACVRVGVRRCEIVW